MSAWLEHIAPAAAALAPVLLALIQLARYWMRLRFLRHVYDRDHDRRDLEVAGKVADPQGLTSAVARRLRGRSRENSP